MGRKVLITFLGTGGLKNNQANDNIKEAANISNRQEAAREYRTAKYKIGDKKYDDKTFISDALCDHYGIDTIFMIGTPGSMWEEAYRVFNKRQGIDILEDEGNEEKWEYYATLLEHCKNATSESELSLPDIEILEKALGNDSKAILIKHGLNDEELNENIATILNLESLLKHDDELYVDITHGFRSIPILMMNALIFLQNVTSKKINIKNISYGMFEGKDTEGYAPVVDLTKTLEVTNWISGAHSFKAYGNANKIANLLKEMEEPAAKSASSLLEKFTIAKNLNNMVVLKQSVQELSGIKFDELPPIARLTVAPVVENFRKAIGNAPTDSEFQYKLAKWQATKHNYLAAYITLSESLITYICECAGLDIKKMSDRETAKKFLRWQDGELSMDILSELRKKLSQSMIPTLRHNFNDITDTRNRLAHSLETNRNPERIKRELDKAFKKVEYILFPKRG